MAYDKFNILKSTAVPLAIENVDTDQIIPARFLKATERVGFGDNLFRDWRYNPDNTPKTEFVLKVDSKNLVTKTLTTENPICPFSPLKTDLTIGCCIVSFKVKFISKKATF